MALHYVRVQSRLRRFGYLNVPYTFHVSQTQINANSSMEHGIFKVNLYTTTSQNLKIKSISQKATKAESEHNDMSEDNSEKVAPIYYIIYFDGRRRSCTNKRQTLQTSTTHIYTNSLTTCHALSFLSMNEPKYPHSK